MSDRRDLLVALRAATARAAGHAGRAVRELVSAAGVFLDELIRVRRDPPDEAEQVDRRPTRVELE